MCGRREGLTFVRFTGLPTSSLAKKRSMLGPIFSYDGTGLWMSLSSLPSFSDGSKPEGKQHIKAVDSCPCGVSRRRKSSSSTVVPRMRRASAPSAGGVVGTDTPFMVFFSVLLSCERWNADGKRCGR